MNEEKLLLKLEKLLALSKSSNQFEAESAMEKAVKIATAHNIDLNRVKQEKGSIKKDCINFGQRLPVTCLYTRDIIRSFFRVKTVSSGNRQYGRKLYFVGKEDDIENAKFVFTFLNETFMRLWQTHYKKNPWLSVATARKSYFLGLWTGLKKKLELVQNSVIQESFNNDNERESYQLVVVDYKKQLDEAELMFFPNLKSAPKNTAKYEDAYSLNAGIKDGGEIQIHSGLEE